MNVKIKTDERNHREQIMLNDSIPHLLLKMSVPTIVGMLITSVYNMADTFFVHYLGTSATGAVGVNFAIEQTIMMAGSLLAVGANSYIARLLGSGGKKKASEILSTAFFVAMALGLLVSILGLIFLEPMVTLLGATKTVKPYAISYGSFLLYAAPFMAANFVANQCLRSEGSATYSMIGMAAGGILNIILDPIFIFVLDMGVAGAAIATSISKVVSFIILIMPYLTRKSLLHLTVKNIKCTLKDVIEIITVGSSSLFRSLLAIIAGIVINQIAGNFSDSCLAAISVVTKIMMVPFSIFLGFGQGLQPICGFNWGAKRYDRVKESFRTATVVSLIMPMIIGVVCAIFASPLINLFTETDAELLAIGRLCLISQCISLPIHSWGVTVNMTYAGLGKAKGAFIMSIARQGICFFPVVFLLPHLMGVNGVAIVQGVADLLTLILALPLAIRLIREINGMVNEQQMGDVIPSSM